METKLIEHGDTAELALKGHLDTRTVKETEKVFGQVGEKYKNIVLDMTDCTYVSSAGIRALRDLYMVIYKKSGTMKMENVNDTVMNVLDMTGLKGLLKVE